ncbi:metallophosphoesterase [Rhizobium ruizarguesonis]
MKAWIISDIHLSLMDRLQGLKIPTADLCVCAGDISNNVEASVRFVRDNIGTRMPVVLVLGNHDYFGGSIEFALNRARDLLHGTDVHLLENESVEFAGHRFVGATLWTDFSVEIGGDEHVPPEERRMHAFGLAPRRMLDFHLIFRSDERREGENGLLTVQEVYHRHKESRAYLDQELAKPTSGKTIVVSHHAPLKESFDHRFHGQVTNACFASDLSSLITLRRPSFWIHGHIHRARDYAFASTRVICNPRGYSQERDVNGFQPGLVIDL